MSSGVVPARLASFFVHNALASPWLLAIRPQELGQPVPAEREKNLNVRWNIMQVIMRCELNFGLWKVFLHLLEKLSVWLIFLFRYIEDIENIIN